MQYCAFTSTVCVCGDCMLNEEEVNSAHLSDVENGFVAGVIKKNTSPSLRIIQIYSNGNHPSNLLKCKQLLKCKCLLKCKRSLICKQMLKCKRVLDWCLYFFNVKLIVIKENTFWVFIY